MGVLRLLDLIDGRARLAARLRAAWIRTVLCQALAPDELPPSARSLGDRWSCSHLLSPFIGAVLRQAGLLQAPDGTRRGGRPRSGPSMVARRSHGSRATRPWPARATTIANTARGAPRRENATSDGCASHLLCGTPPQERRERPGRGNVGADVQPQEQRARVRDRVRREKDSGRKVVDRHRRERADPRSAPASGAAEQLRRSIPRARKDSQRDAHQEQADEHHRADRAQDLPPLQPTSRHLDRGQGQSDYEHRVSPGCEARS